MSSIPCLVLQDGGGGATIVHVAFFLCPGPSPKLLALEQKHARGKAGGREEGFVIIMSRRFTCLKKMKEKALRRRDDFSVSGLKKPPSSAAVFRDFFSLTKGDALHVAAIVSAGNRVAFTTTSIYEL
jgi:hypothetical protein